MDRRDFIKKGTLGAGTIGLTSKLVDPNPLKNKSFTVVLQGDSITDAGRNKSNYYANHGWGMGNGYAFLIASELLQQFPNKNLKIYNRGISGNKVFQLGNRWEEDCLQLKPDVLSILIGVNDFWHTLSGNYKGTVDDFEKDLRSLLDRTKKEYPNLKILMGEPFAVTGGSAITPEWSSFKSYQKVVFDISVDYKTAFIPYQSIFDQALEIASADHWCPDGVHPSLAGSQLMKNAWMKEYLRLV